MKIIALLFMVAGALSAQEWYFTENEDLFTGDVFRVIALQATRFQGAESNPLLIFDSEGYGRIHWGESRIPYKVDIMMRIPGHESFPIEADVSPDQLSMFIYGFGDRMVDMMVARELYITTKDVNTRVVTAYWNLGDIEGAFRYLLESAPPLE